MHPVALLGTNNIYIIYIYMLDVTPFVYIFGLDSNDLYPPTTLIHSAQLGDKPFLFTLIDCHKS